MTYVLPKNSTHEISRFLQKCFIQNAEIIIVFVVFCKESRKWVGRKLILFKYLFYSELCIKIALWKH